MSLIEQALRRVKDPVMSASSKTASPPRARASDHSRAPIAHSWPVGISMGSRSTQTVFLLAVGAVFGLALLLIGVGLVWFHRQFPLATAPTTPPEAVVSTASASTAEPSPPLSVPAEAQDHGLALSGVVEGLGAPYAVINGLVVGIGEQLGDVTVVKIGDGRVTVRRLDGTQEVLRVPR